MAYKDIIMLEDYEIIVVQGRHKGFMGSRRGALAWYRPKTLCSLNVPCVKCISTLDDP